MSRFTLGLVAIGLLLLATACAGGVTSTESGATVTVTSTAKAIELDRANAPAGLVTFNFVNADTMVHSIVLIRTDVPHDKIPADPKDASRPDRAGAVRETGEIAAGQMKKMSVKLAPGSYVLVCNEPAHYIVGMHVPFTVQ